MRFSTRTSWDIAEAPFAAAVRQARLSARPPLDLTVSNPTACGFLYDSRALLPPLSNPDALCYQADPLGMRSARDAVAAYYADHGAVVSPEQVVLTTGTSEAYSYLFRLLCDAGDEILIAQPSYPLFDFLADLDDVRLRSYPLFYDHGWWIDFAELERSIGPRTRAIVLVHPNNPTGHATGDAERIRLEELCSRYSLALIVDEVFLDYPLKPGLPLRSFATGPSPVLTCVLSGMSKVAALPQMKVSWLALLGPDADRQGAMQRLEVIADTFLSMNAPVQLALPMWIEGRHTLQSQIRARTRQNVQALQQVKLDILQADAGWSAVLRLPQRTERQTPAQSLLSRGVIVQDGELYGFRESGRVVISLLTPTDTLLAGAQVIADCYSH